MMIQDVFIEVVLPRIEVKLKELCVMSDGNGKIILTDTGKALCFPIDQNTFTLKFSHGLASDWIQELKSCQDVNFKYPFVFINSEKVTYGVNGITIGEMVIATLGATDGDGNPSNNSNARDEQTFRPILNVLSDLLVETIAECFTVNSNFMPDRRNRYKGQYIDAVGAEYVDAVDFTNFKVQIIKYC